MGISYDALLRFLEDDGLDSILRAKVCGRGTCSSGDCDGSIGKDGECLGIDVIDKVADEICREGKAFMAALAREWAASQVQAQEKGVKL